MPLVRQSSGAHMPLPQHRTRIGRQESDTDNTLLLSNQAADDDCGEGFLDFRARAGGEQHRDETTHTRMVGGKLPILPS